jgi:tyrosyl-tRNA synthetase
VKGGEADPMELKQSLAHAVVARLSGSEAADRAHEHFQQVVRSRKLPDDIPAHTVATDDSGEAGLLAALEAVGLTSSRGEARRLVQQGAVQLDGERVEDAALRLPPGSYLVKVGKRRFARLDVG